ncbi:MAG: HNH endonuclease [Planctomycetes bacterium]|nr:HNH endonuclease [Planctomycetota bacterium]
MEAATLLQRPALVLNRLWTPIRATTAREAICLVVKGTARIVEPETYRVHDLRSWSDVSVAQAVFGGQMIRSARMALLPPEVILLARYDGLGEQAVIFSRRNLFKRDKHTCQYCGAQPGPDALTIDHIVPRSRGGISSWENCVLACVECNKKKANRAPEEVGMTLRKAPRKPRWTAVSQIPPQIRRESWQRFLSRAYWDVELEP